MSRQFIYKDNIKINAYNNIVDFNCDHNIYIFIKSNSLIIGNYTNTNVTNLSNE